MSARPACPQVRKLLPESWGFMCPVHTPDGSPCGLLNHFTAACRVVTADADEPARADAALLQVGAPAGAGWEQELRAMKDADVTVCRAC